ncbi:hypothetical protein CTI12_AA185030 [Artemisia annua]|uniref:Oxidative stress 3 n=1 Tax=Artemisia annua TaxID=35608 RepID=A0A2U1P764_ARTAN|nr:hypothetical protein CTI12_AA185030 [Artemisia annua]
MVGRNHNNNSKEHVQRWHTMQEQDVHDHEQHEKEQPCSSFEEASTLSNGSSSSLSYFSSSSSLDTLDDASSSSAHSSRSSLYDLSDLMSHLPIKRGLSKFYHGKSDSFTSLARVTSIEDLPKKEKVPYKKMKNSYKSHTLPKPIISKKKSRKKHFGSSSIKKDLKE